jgi:hypothetical protein
MNMSKWHIVLLHFSLVFLSSNSFAQNDLYETTSDYLTSDNDVTPTQTNFSTNESKTYSAPQTEKIIQTTKTVSVEKTNLVKKTLTSSGEKTIIVNPNTHRWAAYNAQGKLIRSGVASAGASWCPDLHRACHTKSGVFRIYSLGDHSCKSNKFPLGRGGAPMPYCMYFNGSQGLHGSYEVANANISHGCVRVSVSDAKWIRFNFATIGTKVIVKSY